MRISFNVNGQRVGDQNYFLSVMKQLKPSTVLIMENIGLARRLKTILPETIVVHRTYSTYEGTQWKQNISPKDYVNWLVNGRPGKDIVLYVLNEPVARGDEILNLSQWLSEVANELARINQPAVFGNFSVGSFEKDDIESGKWDYFLDAMEDYKDLHYSGFHEYAGILLPNGIGVWNNNEILNPSAVKRENWPNFSELPASRKSSGSLPDYWHLRRSDWFDIYNTERGRSKLNKILTEFGWDVLFDIKPVFDNLTSRYGISNGHQSLRCQNSLHNIWRAYFPQYSIEDIIMQQLEWADSIYPENYLGMQLFTWSINDPDWDRKWGCDFGKLTRLHDKMIAYAEKNPAITKPDNNTTIVITENSKENPQTETQPKPTETQMVGYNIQREAIRSSYKKILSVAEKIKPAAMTVIAGYDLANDLSNVVDPEKTKIIHRDYYIGDDQRLWEEVNPKETVSRYKKNHKNKDIWIYLLNEPIANGREQVNKLVSWMDETTRRLVDEGFKVVSGNLATGAHKVEDIDDGLYDPWIRMLYELENKVVAGYHEYTLGLIPYGVGFMNPEDLLHKEKVQPQNWPKKEELKLEKWGPAWNRGYPPFWHIMRGQWFNIRAKDINIPQHRSIITEGSIDRMGDVARFERRFIYNGKLANVYDHLEEKHGVPIPWNFLKGHNTYRHVWKDWYPQWSFEDSFFEQFKWLRSVYPESVEGVTIFAWSFADDWDEKYGFNVAELNTFHRMLEDWHYESQTTDNETKSGNEAEDNNQETVPEITFPESETEFNADSNYFDMLDFLKGSGQAYSIRYNWSGGGNEIVWTETTDTNRFFHVKNSNWEEFWYDQNFIYRGTDTSPGGNRLYQNFSISGEYGTEWIPRFWEVGKKKFNQTRVEFRFKDNGQPAADNESYIFSYWIEFKNYYSEIKFGNITLKDVIELWGYVHNTEDNKPGVNFERYWYAKNFGLVAWEDPTTGKKSGINELNKTKRSRENILWLTLPEINKNNIILPESDERWEEKEISSTGEATNVRSDADINSRIITSIGNNVKVIILEDEKVADPNSVNFWVPVRFPVNSADENPYKMLGWIRDDVFTVTHSENTAKSNTAELTITYRNNDKGAKLIADIMQKTVLIFENYGFKIDISLKEK